MAFELLSQQLKGSRVTSNVPSVDTMRIPVSHDLLSMMKTDVLKLYNSMKHGSVSVVDKDKESEPAVVHRIEGGNRVLSAATHVVFKQEFAEKHSDEIKMPVVLIQLPEFDFYSAPRTIDVSKRIRVYVTDVSTNDDVSTTPPLVVGDDIKVVLNEVLKLRSYKLKVAALRQIASMLSIPVRENGKFLLKPDLTTAIVNAGVSVV